MLPEYMVWTCTSCGDGGGSKSSAEVTHQRVEHWRANPYCGVIVMTWVDPPRPGRGGE